MFEKIPETNPELWIVDQMRLPEGGWLATAEVTASGKVVLSMEEC